MIRGAKPFLAVLVLSAARVHGLPFAILLGARRLAPPVLTDDEVCARIPCCGGFASSFPASEFASLTTTSLRLVLCAEAWGVDPRPEEKNLLKQSAACFRRHGSRDVFERVGGSVH